MRIGGSETAAPRGPTFKERKWPTSSARQAPGGRPENFGGRRRGDVM